MGSHGVIKSLDIVENSGFGGISRGEVMQIDAFALDAREEVFGDGIVVRVAFAGHTLLDSEAVKGLAKGVGGILNTAIRVENQPRLRFLPPNGHVESVEGEFCVDSVAHGIAHDLL